MPAGTYAFEANKSGFIAGAYGRVRPGGQPQSIDLKDSDRVVSLRITMWEYASVAGTVRDETGEAVVGMQVRALRHASAFLGELLGASVKITLAEGEKKVQEIRLR